MLGAAGLLRATGAGSWVGLSQLRAPVVWLRDGAATARSAGEEDVMKKLSRVILVSSVVALGALATPVAAIADPPQREELGTTAEALHGGGRKLMEHALSDLELRPEQQSAVDRLRTEAESRHAPVKKAKREFMMALADQVENGKIDRCALAPKTKALAGAMAEAHAGDRAAFERLHAILDPEQRTRFVESIRQHWEWSKKDKEPGAVADKMAKELNLATDQKASIQRILSALAEIREADPAKSASRERWSRILDAFKSDRFVLGEVAPPGEDVAAKRAQKIERGLWAAEAVVPVLNEEQRSTAARRIREKVQEQSGSERARDPGMEGPDE